MSLLFLFTLSIVSDTEVHGTNATPPYKSGGEPEQKGEIEVMKSRELLAPVNCSDSTFMYRHSLMERRTNKLLVVYRP